MPESRPASPAGSRRRSAATRARTPTYRYRSPAGRRARYALRGLNTVDLDLLGLQARATALLDVGCGTGRHVIEALPT